MTTIGSQTLNLIDFEVCFPSSQTRCSSFKQNDPFIEQYWTSFSDNVICINVNHLNPQFTADFYLDISVQLEMHINVAGYIELDSKDPRYVILSRVLSGPDVRFWVGAEGERIVYLGITAEGPNSAVVVNIAFCNMTNTLSEFKCDLDKILRITRKQN